MRLSETPMSDRNLDSATQTQVLRAERLEVDGRTRQPAAVFAAAFWITLVAGVVWLW